MPNPIELSRYHPQIRELAAQRQDAPVCEGDGIVTCAGGSCYFTCTYVQISVLRALGCELPVEVWHRGPAEMSEAMRELLESFDGVRVVDVFDTARALGLSRVGGWETKVLGVMYSGFRRVLFLDCDNVPVRDPRDLFGTAAFERDGAIFWPDRYMGKGSPHRTMIAGAWQACDVQERDEPEFESGQFMVDKQKPRVWDALRLAHFYNQQSDFFYRYLFGDKDTFHMAWRKLELPYTMPTKGPVQDWEHAPVLHQHDLDGRRLFQHRNADKWEYGREPLKLKGFQHEELCREALNHLRHRWDGVVRQLPEDYTPRERQEYDLLCKTRHYRYHAGPEGRVMEFRPDHTIGRGARGYESMWELESTLNNEPLLTLHNGSRRLCTMSRYPEGWTGFWQHFDRKKVKLTPLNRVEARNLARRL